MKKPQTPITVRMLPELHGEFTAAAKQDHRSVNNLIVLLIEQYLNERDYPKK